MKLNLRILSGFLLVLMLALSLAACGGKDTTSAPDADKPQTETSKNETSDIGPIVDYAGTVKLEMASNTAKQLVTVNTFVDGDTTHFNVPTGISENGILKARYLGVNTPESTGKIEEWGHAASDFTRKKLENAESIMIESEDATWNSDSTGTRFLAWVWYKEKGSDEYRNLNIELLQNGLGIASNSKNNRYGDTCMAAIGQAKRQKLNVYSGEKDPDFYYGDAMELTLKELRINVAEYNGKKVAFNGIITQNSNNGVFVEYYDSETDMYYGINVYYGFSLNGAGLEILQVGNEVRIVGTVQFREVTGSYQISGVSYNIMQPQDPNNIQKLSEGHEGKYKVTDAKTFLDGKVNVIVNGEEKAFSYAELAVGSTIQMDNLKIKSIYTTTKEDSSSKGAMTFTCEAEGRTITVRTEVLYDENGEVLTSSAYEGKTIDAKGIIDYYNGTYQIKVFVRENITIKN